MEVLKDKIQKYIFYLFVQCINNRKLVYILTPLTYGNIYRVLDLHYEKTTLV